MRTEYNIRTSLPAAPTRNTTRNFGLACAASGIIGLAIGIVTLSYPAAVPSDRWSYPFDASAQWVISIVLAVTHLLTLAGFLGVIARDVYGRSRVARVALWVAVVGCAVLAVCEVLSGAVGTRRSDSPAANALGGGFGVGSLLLAAGCIVAGIVIVKRCGLRDIGWSMVLWSGVILILLVTPANIAGSSTFGTVALMLWSLTFVPLGVALTRSRHQVPGVAA